MIEIKKIEIKRREREIRKRMKEVEERSKEHEILDTLKKCQRNWDYKKFNSKSKEQQQAIVYELLYTAQNSPSKQYESYFDLYYTADREVIQEISRYTWGTTHRRTPPANWRNSQANASIYIIWVAKEPETTLNCNADGTLKDNTHHERWLNAYVSIGISMGLTARTAVKMGMVTGFNKSHNDLNGDDFWEKRLGILEEINAGTKKIAYGLGIGYRQYTKPRWVSEDTELMIGAANGSKITLTEQDTHPRTGMKMRKAKIVDIKNRANEIEIDPYGVEHMLPENTNILINGWRERKIKVTEIK